MNRLYTENTRRFCALLAAGMVATLAGCGANKTKVADAADGTDAATVAEGTPVSGAAAEPMPAADRKLAATPDGTMMPVLNRTTTNEGLVIDDLKIGEGTEASSDSTIVIHYHGTLPDGTIFDSSRGQPAATFPLSRLIQGWRQGIPGMRVGGIRCLTVPAELAYGSKGVPKAGIPSNATLIFSIQLVDIVSPEKADAEQ